MEIVLTINGKERRLPVDTTVSGILDMLSLHPERVVVEINQIMIKRAVFGETIVRDGDKIEILEFVGGG